jgi:transposase-like protein
MRKEVIIMSTKRRTFTAEQKTKIVLEAIRGEKEINELATEYKLQPNLIRNWKREFLEKASTVFDTKRDEKAMEAVNGLQEENDELAKKVGRLSIEVDWLKKKSEETFGSDYESKFSKKPKGL